MTPLMTGSLGVALLLVAFVLNLAGYLNERGPVYLMMNFVGAGLACVYAWEGRIIPFVILEIVWGLSALVQLIISIRKGPRSTRA